MKKRSYKDKYWFHNALSLGAAVVIYVVLTHFSSIWGGIRTFAGYFSPIFLGGVIAYLVAPLADMYRRKLFCRIRAEKRRIAVSNAAAFTTVLAVLILLLIILIPQLIESASTFIADLDIYLAKLKESLPELKFFGKALDLQKFLSSREKMLSTAVSVLKNNTDAVLKTSALAGKSLIQWLIALFLSVYFLAEKDKLKSGAARLVRALLPAERFEAVSGFVCKCDLILKRYVVFNLLDSLIIGVANALFMAVAGIPYLGLVSFIIAVTNLIPTFGPVIGAAVGALLISLVNIRYTIAFLIFTVLLQLCDAYLVKPKLFGSSLGVSSLWILIGIVAGGRMFGTVGMLLAIPGVAVLDLLYSEHILPMLERKQQKQRETLEQSSS